MILPKPTFLVVIWLLLFSAAQAEESVLGLYEAEVPVEDQGAEQRQQALREALEEVLNKVAEAQRAPVDPARIDAALEKAERYVQQYRYTEEGLWVLFDRRAVDAMLEQASGTGQAALEALQLRITGIRSLPDYAQVIHYLGSLKMLSSARPRLVTPEAVLFELRSRNGKQGVIRAIVHDGFLAQRDRDASIPTFHYSP